MPWDFALILIFFAVAVPLLGRRRIRQLTSMPETTKRDRLRVYASTVAFQWFAAAVVLWRTTAHRIPLERLGIGLPRPALTAVVSIALAALVLANQLFSLRRLSKNHAEVKAERVQMATR